MKHFIEKLLRCHQGVAAIEFALIAPVILVMMIGATDYGLAAINKITLTSAVRSGVQIVLGGTCGDGSKTRYFLQITADHLYQPVLLQTPLALSATSTVRYN